MKFCIISPTYNAEKFVKECIDSVKMQKDCEYRHVLVNDASTDKTFDIIQEECAYDSRCYVVNKSTRLGTLHSHILGTELSEAHLDDVIVHLDGDDAFAHAEVLSRIKQEYEKGYLATYGNYRIAGSEKFHPEVTKHSVCGPKVTNIAPRQQIHNPGWRYGAIRTFKKFLFDRIPPYYFFDSSATLFSSAADVAIFLPIIEMIGWDNLAYIEEELMIHNYHPLTEWQRDDGAGMEEKTRCQREMCFMKPLSKLSDINELATS